MARTAVRMSQQGGGFHLVLGQLRTHTDVTYVMGKHMDRWVDGPAPARPKSALADVLRRAV